MKKVILKDFQRFLSEKKMANPNSIPYLSIWVANCYDSFDLSLTQPLNETQKQEFIAQFTKNHEDWQVKQAQDALRLFQFFQGNNLFNKDKTNLSHLEKWQNLEKQTRKLLRLKHRSQSTEKAYINWLRSFGFRGHLT